MTARMAVAIESKYPLNQIYLSPIAVIIECLGEQGKTLWTPIYFISLEIVQTDFRILRFLVLAVEKCRKLSR